MSGAVGRAVAPELKRSLGNGGYESGRVSGDEDFEKRRVVLFGREMEGASAVG